MQALPSFLFPFFYRAFVAFSLGIVFQAPSISFASKKAQCRQNLTGHLQQDYKLVIALAAPEYGVRQIDTDNYGDVLLKIKQELEKNSPNHEHSADFAEVFIPNQRLSYVREALGLENTETHNLIQLVNSSKPSGLIKDYFDEISDYISVKNNISEQLNFHFNKNSAAKPSVNYPLLVPQSVTGTSLLLPQPSNNFAFDFSFDIEISYFQMKRKPFLKLLELTLEHDLGSMVSRRKRTYRGFPGETSEEFYYLNTKDYSGVVDKQTLQPQILVLQHHQKGHNFLSESTNKAETIPPHFNLRGLQINSSPKFSAISKSGDRFHVEILSEEDPDYKNRRPPSYISILLQRKKDGETKIMTLSLMEKNANNAKDPFYFYITNDKGDIVLDSSFSELTDEQFLFLEDLNVLHYFDLSSEDVEEHLFY